MTDINHGAELLTTLGWVLRHCSDWDSFCREYGWSEWAVQEGGGEVEVRLPLEDARRHGLLERN